ncbi:MAG: FAD-dependent oxidoreductase, partial [Parvibaculaceae bacterium]
MHLPHLSSPIGIRGKRFKNRIFSSGHQTVLVNDGVPNEALVAYHEARARGGVGLIVAEIGAVHETAFFSTHTIEAYSDRCIAGYRKLADMARRYDCRIFGQLFHPGREVYGVLPDGRRPVAYGPSAIPAERYLTASRPMTRTMIAEVVAAYGKAAARLKEAGLDGAEVVASHGYLPAQFLNPRVNLRTDDYGGSEQNLRRFLEEVLRAVRRAVGTDFIVGLRISADERTEEGLSTDEILRALQAIDRESLIDYASLVAGTSNSNGGAIHIVPPMRMPQAYIAETSGRIRCALGVPVMLTGRINQPQIAEQVLKSGQADMCGMTRAMIADPEMPNKAFSAKLDDIRACIGCNQACIHHMQIDAPISCIQRPETGRELKFGTMSPALKVKRVVVVGGGPSGMKAAVTAAARGHLVTLYERRSQLGGQGRLA